MERGAERRERLTSAVPPALSPIAGAERFPSKMKGGLGKCLKEEDGKQSRQRTHTCVNTVNSGGSERRGACVCVVVFCAHPPMDVGLLERDGEMWADRELEAEAGSGAFGRWCRAKKTEGEAEWVRRRRSGEAMCGVGVVVGGGTAEINH